MNIDELAPLMSAIGGQGPWIVLGALTLRGLHTWTKHLCALAPRVIELGETLARDGLKVRVVLDDGGQNDRPEGR